jgi:YidC/Oxa1 family membrane protein insertase
VQAANTPKVDPGQLRKSLLTWGLVAAAVIVGTQLGWGNIWREGLVRPMLNALLFLYMHLGESFILAILVFTLVLRLITSPLQIKQIQSSRRMAAMQPKLQELQKKHAGNKEKIVQEQQKLYKQGGINPLGGCLPTLIQFPIWIVLYQSINAMLADTPIELLRLGKDVYAGFAGITRIVPLESTLFGSLNLAQPDPTSIILPVLVGGSMWLQQRMMTQPSGDAQQASMNQTMQIMMPLMFGYFTTQFASGLAIYFLISNVIGIVMQWAIERFAAPVSLEDLDSKAAVTDKEKEKNEPAKKRKR